MNNQTASLFAIAAIADPDLTLEELATLGGQLELPDGWRFESRVLTETLHVAAIDGMAEILQDVALRSS